MICASSLVKPEIGKVKEWSLKHILQVGQLPAWLERTDNLQSNNVGSKRKEGAAESTRYGI